ncbi:hypothetical protein FKM82_009043 [Ascaphus truei]
MASPPTLGQPVLPAGSNLNHNNNNNSSSVKKCGYLRKQKHGHKRYFVLREPGEGCTAARLEYYENEKKWRSKSAAAKRVIALDSCLNINKRADAKNKYLIALYTRDEYFAVAAESEQEQESWYRALTELLSTGRGEKDGVGCAGTGGCCCPGTPGGGSNSGCINHLAQAEDLNYGLVTPASAVYREIWQVNLKPKGLGQTRGMTGVYRLCLSARTISFVRLNSETPSVTLQLMNIRRCGHSDNYFFVEVGRSASTGPGEIWMQADDSVVAQSIHETILEAMRAMRELAEFRPRSKSQSSSSNPISVPGRRHHHLNQLPPSQTGLARRTRTDFPPPCSSVSLAANASLRLRTASEGDSSGSRVVSGSPLSPSALRAPLSRSHTLSSGGRNGRLVPAPGPLQHSRSMSMPVPRSPPSAASPISLSSGSSSGHGSASDPLLPPQPSSCSASASGSPSDPGFMSLDEYGSSPGELTRVCLSCRSGTPDSVSDTPPQPGELNGYMSMERLLPGGCARIHRRLEGSESEKAHRKRTYSLTNPGRQRVAPHVSSTSLDEATLIRATFKGSPGLLPSSPKVPYHPYPEDYGDVEIGRQGNYGYMHMTPGAGTVPSSNYMPMSPASVSAPQQILQPRTCCTESLGGSQEDSPEGYMRMWSGPKHRPVHVQHRLSLSEPQTPVTPPDYFILQPGNSCCCQTHTVSPRQPSRGEAEPYVLMNCPASSSPHSRATRPSRLALRTLPSMSEHPPDQASPPGGEYIHIHFGEPGSQNSMPRPPLPALPASTPESAAGSPASSSSLGSEAQHSPISDYINLDFGSSPPKPSIPSLLGPHSDYTEMSPRKTPADPSPTILPPAVAPLPMEGSGVQCLTLLMDQMSGAFSLPNPPDPNRGAKLIRADPQGGRRRHSSETFSSTTTVTPVSPSFAHSPKRHSSASVENVSVRPGDVLEAAECGSPMCRETSAGFQNGLNYIAIDLPPEERGLLLLTQASSRGHLPATGLTGLDIGAYASIDFLLHRMKGATTVRGE